jgi:hypothetical protein
MPVRKLRQGLAFLSILAFCITFGMPRLVDSPVVMLASFCVPALVLLGTLAGQVYIRSQGVWTRTDKLLMIVSVIGLISFLGSMALPERVIDKSFLYFLYFGSSGVTALLNVYGVISEHRP